MRLRLGLGVTLFVVVGCFRSSAGLPQPGDHVQPGLTQRIDWKASERGSLWVDLRATNTAGQARRLGFNASPRHNPVASIQFFDQADQPLAKLVIELKERC